MIVDNAEPYFFETKEESVALVNILSIELLNKIFSYLTLQQRLSSLTTCRLWKTIILDTVKREEFRKLEIDLDFLSSNLVDEPIITRLNELKNSVIYEKINPLECSYFLISYKIKQNIESLIHRLKEIPDEHLSGIRKIILDNNQFANLTRCLKISDIYKKEAQIPNLEYKFRDGEYKNVSELFLEQNEFNASLRVASKIRTLEHRNTALSALIIRLARNGNYGAAESATAYVVGERFRFEAIYLIEQIKCHSIQTKNNNH